MWVIRNDELYHWGIKGMKWRKHKKKMSDLEARARLAEGAARSRDEAAQKYLNASKVGLKGSMKEAQNKNMKYAMSESSKADRNLQKKKGAVRIKKAKGFIKGLFSRKYSPFVKEHRIGRKKISTIRTKKLKGGTVTRTEMHTKGYVSTKYTPNEKKRKGAKW